MTAREVKIEMLNKALQIMTGYQSDIVYDFESIDEISIHRNFSSKELLMK